MGIKGNCASTKKHVAKPRSAVCRAGICKQIKKGGVKIQALIILLQCIFAGMKILMVCLGNICRSPLAAGILQHKADKVKLGWTVESSGTSNYHIGDPPHKLSQKVALLNGVDISDQRGSRFKKEDMLTFDRIYAMDSDNYNEMKRMSGGAWDADKTDLILNELYPGKNISVPDPWFGGEDGFHEVYEMLDKACEKIISRLR